MAGVREGDERSFEVLFERYRAPVGAYVASLVRDRGHSEDITQEVFIAALRSLRASDRPVLFKPWIYEIARNACIDRHRRNRRRDEIAGGMSSQLDTDPARLISARATPEAVTESRQRFAELCRTLMEMPALDRRLIVMRELEGRSYREIVDRAGLSAAAVESALFRARRRLTERREAAAEANRDADARRAPRPATSLPAAAELARRRFQPLRRPAGRTVASVSSSS